MADSASGEPSRAPSPALGPRWNQPASHSQPLRCCCGRSDCAFLEYNCSVLDGVEKDVHAAAKMGQALLARHEAYVASAERDRTELNARILQLQSEKATLEKENTSLIEENRTLLDQLEHLNGSVADSDTKIRGLEAALHTSQQTARRLEGAAARAEGMEQHIAVLESEQLLLQTTLVQSQEEARSAVFRWKQAERGLSDVQQQLDRLERQAKEERELHAEAIDRVERQRAVEKDLHTAAGRLKAAAAAKSLGDSNRGSNVVVSHFVRDLLQDNANLQLGIAEVREMLNSSHDEIQMLQEQLLYHQPASHHQATATEPTTLKAELGLPDHAASQNPSKELHVHHHYYVPPHAQAKNPKRRRQALNTGMSTPPRPSPPRSHWRPNRPRPAPTLLTHSAKPSVSSAPSPANRWSLQSDQRAELISPSVASTPQSSHGRVIFDDIAAEVLSLMSPTTSVDPMSPSLRPAPTEAGAQAMAASLSATARLPASDTAMGDSHPEDEAQETCDNLAVEEGGEPESTPSIEPDRTIGDIASQLPEPEDPCSSLAGHAPEPTATAQSTVDRSITCTVRNEAADSEPPREGRDGIEVELQRDPRCFDPYTARRPKALRRMASHESIMSLSNGLDIHTLKSRPAQLAFRPLASPAAATGLSAVTAAPTISRFHAEGKRGSALLRDNLMLSGLSLATPRSGESSRAGSDTSSIRTVRQQHGPSPRVSSSGTRALGKLVSWRPWGVGGGGSGGGARRGDSEVAEEGPACSAAPDAPHTAAAAPTPSRARLSTPAPDQLLSTSPGGRKKEPPRAPGINQPGAIPGFYEFWAAQQRRGAPSKVCPDVVDRDALKDGLEGR